MRATVLAYTVMTLRSLDVDRCLCHGKASGAITSYYHGVDVCVYVLSLTTGQQDQPGRSRWK